MPTAIGFIGKHDLRIDDKSRLTIPARFKSILAEQYPDDEMQVVMTVSLDKNLRVLPASQYAKETIRYEQYNDLDKESRQIKALFLGMSQSEKVDAGGRIRIDAGLREIAQLDRDVTIIGGNSCFEIWDREKWNANQAAILGDLEHLIEQVRAKNPVPARQTV